MPKGRPKRVVLPEPVKAEVVIEQPSLAQPVQPKKVYSCGCAVVRINAERNKAKCVKHGVA